LTEKRSANIPVAKKESDFPESLLEDYLLFSNFEGSMICCKKFQISEKKKAPRDPPKGFWEIQGQRCCIWVYLPEKFAKGKKKTSNSPKTRPSAFIEKLDLSREKF